MLEAYTEHLYATDVEALIYSFYVYTCQCEEVYVIPVELQLVLNAAGDFVNIIHESPAVH